LIKKTILAAFNSPKIKRNEEASTISFYELQLICCQITGQQKK
jgi:hypothetical protein